MLTFTASQMANEKLETTVQAYRDYKRILSKIQDEKNKRDDLRSVLNEMDDQITIDCEKANALENAYINAQEDFIASIGYKLDEYLSDAIKGE